MARAPQEEPEGLVYRPEVLTAEHEAELLERFEELRFDPIVLHGQAVRLSLIHI